MLAEHPRTAAGWEQSKVPVRAPQHAQHNQLSSAAAASRHCLATVTRCLWQCEHFAHGLLSAPPGELRANPVLPALAEVLRAWARVDERTPGRAGQEQLSAPMAALHDALASAFPQLFKQGAFACCHSLLLHGSRRYSLARQPSSLTP